MKYTEARKLQEAYAKCNGLNCAMVACVRLGPESDNFNYLLIDAPVGTYEDKKCRKFEHGNVGLSDLVADDWTLYKVNVSIDNGTSLGAVLNFERI